MRYAHPWRRPWLGWLSAALALASAARADATEDPTAPSACSPPGPAGQTAAPDPGPPPPAAPPPPAYMPPPGYPPAPPPGYQGAAPPGYAYPPPEVYAPPPRPPRSKRMFLVLPNLGMHSLRNGDAFAYDPGLRFGVIGGHRFRDWFALAADMTIDVSNRHGVAAGDSFSEWTFDLAISPLFQLPVGRLELVAGPKAGYYTVQTDQRTMGVTDERDGRGFSIGITAGVFVPVSPATSLGVLISFEQRSLQQTCRTTGSVEMCTSASQRALPALVLGVSGGVLF